MSDKTKTPVQISGLREHRLNLSKPEHHARIAELAKALSSPVRVKILHLLSLNTLSVQEVAMRLDIPTSSAAFHVQALEEAGLIVTESQPGKRGSMRVCVCSMQLVQIINEFTTVPSAPPSGPLTVDMPIGNYHSCDIRPTCGIASEAGMIGTYDDPSWFYSPERVRAQLIWFSYGFLEYRFPNLCIKGFTPREVSFVLELCSEAPGYKEDWPSDIDIWVCGQKICTYTSPGDFGARRGVYTPATWRSPQTQYGLLTNFAIRSGGVYINDVLADPSITLASFDLLQNPYIPLKLEVRPDAEHSGGINLFGERFGDHAQGIVMRIAY